MSFQIPRFYSILKRFDPRKQILIVKTHSVKNIFVNFFAVEKIIFLMIN